MKPLNEQQTAQTHEEFVSEIKNHLEGYTYEVKTKKFNLLFYRSETTTIEIIGRD